ncbi:tyrosine-protein phosphatase [Tellurirhabdus bombi]|uniref:tyrosine-protein phosphatase n=1 Tax=Tellurirhabdus bombi TaxID=2907205 RepID=UPI001F329D34|nr:CpsB/CapC family capsule biosynthesis tyrosine phosphatase [Tellurirhabdus bombi]
MAFPFLPLGRKPSNSSFQPPTLQVDVHAHLLPGRHDGTDSVDHSLMLLNELAAYGFRKVIATLHIMDNYYDNTAASILATAAELTERLEEEYGQIEIKPAAEYYIDRGLMRLLYKQEPLLTFSDAQQKHRYLLFDTSLVTAPQELEDAIRAFRKQGITPVMTHPEQYIYLQKMPSYLFTLQEMGVLFQVNILSLVGQPSREAKQLAEWMIDQKLVSFLGSNLQKDHQLPLLHYAMTLPYYQKVLQAGILNNTI